MPTRSARSRGGPKAPDKPAEARPYKPKAKPTGRKRTPSHLPAEEHELCPTECHSCGATALDVVDRLVEDKLHVVKEHQRRRDPSRVAPLLEVQAYCAAPLSMSAPGYPARQCFGVLDCVAYGANLTSVDDRCVPRGSAGDPCVGTGTGVGSPCGDGLHCAQGVCAPDLQAGAACAGDATTYCAAGLDCRGGTCSSSPATGEPCQGILDCANGLRCVASSQHNPTGPGVCMAFDANWRQPCTADWQCPDVCVGGFCNPLDNHFCVSPY